MLSREGENLLRYLNLDEIIIDEEKYILISSLSGNGAASFKFKSESREFYIFVKFLIAPNNNISIEKFKLEYEILKLLNNQLDFLELEITPKPLIFKKHPDYPIYFYATKWVEGNLLSEKIPSLIKGQVKDTIDIIHRISSAMAYIGSSIAHRDLHPGNIIILNETGDFLGDVVNPKIVITDFGNAIMPIAFHYAEEENNPYANMELFKNVTRRIEGSFRSSPPEAFLHSMNGQLKNPGSGESWSIGILFYKLLSGENLLDVKTVHEYIEIIYNKEIHQIVADKLKKIKLDDYIIRSLLRKMLEVESYKRISPAGIATVLWNYRFSDLKNKDYTYIDNFIEFEGRYPRKRPDEYDFY